MDAYKLLSKHYHSQITSFDIVYGCSQIRLEVPRNIKPSEMLKECSNVLRKHNHKLVQTYIARDHVGHLIYDGTVKEIIRSYIVLESRIRRKKGKR